jgi:hypothetical protein
MGVFKAGFLKCFLKGNVWFKGGLDLFSQNNTKTNKENVWLWGVCLLD